MFDIFKTELLLEKSNSDSTKIAKLYKFENNKYISHCSQLKPPTGDLGYKMPSREIPHNMYEAAKFQYEWQFEPKMMVVSCETFSTVEEAKQNLQQFLEDEDEAAE